MNKIVETFSRLLEPGDREYVCGDVEELQLSAPNATANIFDLFIRRQLAEWSHWSRWLALFGVAGLAGYSLSGSLAQLKMGIVLQLRTYLKYGVAYEPGGVGVWRQIAYSVTLMSAMLLWYWACGAVLASLSGRALWITSFLFYAAVQDSWLVRMALAGNIILKHGLAATILMRLLPLDPLMLAFLFALFFGSRSARTSSLTWNKSLLLLAGALLLVILLAWMKNWFTAGFAQWSGQPYVPVPFLRRVLPLLAGAWPVFLMPLLRRSFSRPADEGRLA